MRTISTRNKHIERSLYFLAHLCRELDESDEQDDTDHEEDAEVFTFEKFLITDVNCSNYDTNRTESDEEPEKIEIHSLQTHFSPTTDEILGACIDSGAQCMVIGHRQAEAYIRDIGVKVKIKQDTGSSMKRFRFGATKHKGLGVLPLFMPVSDDIVITFDAYVVPIDVPLLLGIHVLHHMKHILDFSDGTMVSNHNSWRANLVQKRVICTLSGLRRFITPNLSFVASTAIFTTHPRTNSWD